MKKILLIALATLWVAGAWAAPKMPAFRVNRIEPTNWFVGMKNPSVQLMVYGENIRNAEVKTDYAGVKIDSVVRLDSPNYLLVYLNIAGAQPGTMKIDFTIGKLTMQVKYDLKAREMSGDRRMGFTNADVLYMLMPDRFANGNPANDRVKGMRSQVCDRNKPSYRHGGDLEGIRQHLDYLNDLGVTALWFTPVLENDSPESPWNDTYHGYATTNYYRVDPRFGTNDDYRRLVDDAHSKGLKVVMDMIFNHCGFEHPWVADMPSNDWFNTHEWLKESNGTSDTRGTNFLRTSYKLAPVLDPYASKVDKKETVEGWFVSTMPDLNQNNPHVMNYLIQNSIWWIETVGIDGIRMDTYPYAFAGPMARWMKTIDEEYPNFNVVGETWFEEPPYTAAWQRDSKIAKENSYLKTVMDFSFYACMDSARIEQTDGQWRGFNRVYNSLVFDYLYPNPSSVMAFIENHDTDRYLKDGKDDLTLKQALALLLTINRIPQLYYGTEVLMNGTKHVTDGNVRKDFPGGFPGDTHNAFTEQGRTKEENDMYNWLRTLLNWRKGSGLDVITKGKQTQFLPHNGIYVVARQYEGKTVMTIVNGTNENASMPVKRYAEIIGNALTARDIPTSNHVSLVSDIILTPRQTLILEF
ncbi:MAG: glycoside hydrolase family 13 protein [Muribaculaceae bacterium]|nr:glycoside hydrolase family 13 protein [Muribaculaceae bacterium]